MQSVRLFLKRFLSLNPKQYALILLVIVSLLMLPYLIVQTHVGHDLLFHLNRIEGLSQAYSHLEILPSIFYNVFNGVGYGTPLFYGNLAIILPASLYALGIPLIIAWKINIVVTMLLAAISCFLCARIILRNDFAAFVMSVVFVFSGYFATDIFFRASLGEAASFVLIPFSFLGLNSILSGNKKLWIMLPLGLSLMLYCHLLSVIVTTFGLFLYTLFHVKSMLRQPVKFLLILFSVGLFLLFSAFYILPLCEQLFASSFRATSGISAVVYGELSDQAMPWWSLASDLNMAIHAFVDSNRIWIPNGLGLAFPLMLFTFFQYRKTTNMNRMLPMLILCMLTLLLCSEIFPWQIKFLQRAFGIIQFPWRFLLLSIFFLSLYAGEFISAMKTNRAMQLISILFIVFSLLSFTVSEVQELAIGLSHTLKNDVIEYNYHDNVGTGEYLPPEINEHTFPILQQGVSANDVGIVVTDQGEKSGVRTVGFTNSRLRKDATIVFHLFFQKPISVIAKLPNERSKKLSYTQTDSEVRVEIGQLNCGTIQFNYAPMIKSSNSVLAATADVVLDYGSAEVEFSDAREGDWIEAPLLWYEGYQAQYSTVNGSASSLPVFAGTQGLCRVYLNGYTAGTLKIEYRHTPIQIISSFISFAAYTCIGIWLIWKWKNNVRKEYDKIDIIAKDLMPPHN